MPTIHVCSLTRLRETVTVADASHVLSLVNVGTPVDCPPSVHPDRHLYVGVSDVIAPTEGMVLPDVEHVQQLLGFVDGWNRERPMVIHCFAGISRSTAAAFIAVCRLTPSRPESEIARLIRSRSPTAWPNPLLVELADTILGREGRMIRAIEDIGSGNGAFEAEPFSIPVGGKTE